MCRNQDETLGLKQTRLIDRVLEALGLDTKMATGKWTPVEATPLTKDEEGGVLQDYLATVVLWECCYTCLATVNTIFRMP